MNELDEHIEDLWDDAIDAVVIHMARGDSPERAISKVARSLDDLFAFDRLFPGAVGNAIERHDGTLFEGMIERIHSIVQRLKELLRRDPEKRRTRQARRQKRRAERRARRAARRGDT